uniref:EGF-like domain-containing protein n=1 Tax=Heterorhabditis bacteriophora TaxID=37862 RepID=A0A1I7W654_HETBA
MHSLVVYLYCKKEFICRLQKSYPCKSTKCSDPNLMRCSQRGSNPQCVCIPGTTYNKDTKMCDDIDECVNKPCSLNATCVNLSDGNGYYCVCPDGQISKGDKCIVDIHCEKLHSGITIDIKQMSLMINKRCVNIDECFENKYTCPKNCICKDKTPGYDCVCKQGYERPEGANNTVPCTDINECLESNICPDGSICQNTQGSYLCQCLPPLIQHGNFDCAYNTTDGCDSECVSHSHCLKVMNEKSVYNCTCDYGYEGSGNVQCTSMLNNFIIGFLIYLKYIQILMNAIINYCQTRNICPLNSDCIQLKTPRNGRWITCKCNTKGFRFNENTFTCEGIFNLLILCFTIISWKFI